MERKQWSCDPAQRGDAPAYSLMLGLLALWVLRPSAGVAHMPEFAQGFKEFGNNFAVPALFLYTFWGGASPVPRRWALIAVLNVESRL